MFNTRFIAFWLSVAGGTALAVGAGGPVVSAQPSPVRHVVSAQRPTPDGTPSSLAYFEPVATAVYFNPVPPPCYGCPPPLQIGIATYGQLVGELGNPTELSGNLATWTHASRALVGNATIATKQSFAATFNASGTAVKFALNVTQGPG